MSDAAKDPDIEDVLASVRRLVTAERKDRAAAPSALVLTPSQRVETPSLRAVEPDAPAPPVETDVDRALAGSDVADARWEEDEPQDAFAAWSEEARGGDACLAAVPTIGEASAEATEADDPSDSDVEDAPTAHREDDDDASEDEAWEIEADAASVGIAPDPAEGVEEAGEAAPRPEEDAPSVAFRHAGDAAETPAPSEAGYADVEEVELDGVTDIDPDAVEDAEILGDEGSELDVLDESALRAMVSEIVRDELRGPLGERITSNVRKLVRREIHRILAARDFE